MFLENYHIIENFMASLRFLFVLSTSVVIYLYIITNIFPRKHSMKLLIYFCFFNQLIYKFLFVCVLKDMIREFFSLQVLYAVLEIFCAFGVFAVNVYTFDSDWVKIMLVTVITDLSVSLFSSILQTGIDFLEKRAAYGSFMGNPMWLDLLYPVIGGLFLLLLMKKAGPLLGKIRNYQLKARNIWKIIVPIIISCVTIYWTPAPIYTNQDMIFMLKEICIILILFSGVLTGLQLYFSHLSIMRNKVTQEYKSIQKQQELFAAYKKRMTENIRQMEQSREFINRQIAAILSSADWSNQSGYIKKYLEDMQKQYEQLCFGLYCEDWSLDAVLSKIAENFRKKGYPILISAADYSGQLSWRNPAGEILFFLSSLMETELSKIRKEQLTENSVALSIGTIRNLFIIRMHFPYAGQMKRLERQIKKYTTPFDCDSFLTKKENHILIELMLPLPEQEK